MKHSTGVRVFLLSTGITLLTVFSVLSYDITKDKVAYIVCGGHLDTEWEWTRDYTINTLLPKTLTGNFALFTQYPKYIFNFEGAWRYYLIKKHYPAQYEQLKKYIASGNWICNGAMVEGADVGSISVEAIIRQSLYGQGYFMDEFGKKSNDLYVPDCFGFPYSIPTIAAHCGLKGISTMKLQVWQKGAGVPWSIGRWIGPDGNSIVGALRPYNYTNQDPSVFTADGDLTKSQSNGAIWATYKYVGTGDQGVPLGADAVAKVLNQVAASPSSAGVYSVCARSDQLYTEMTSTQFNALPTYNGELIMQLHGNGTYTSHADIKWRNDKNQLLGVTSEHAAAIANMMVGTPYPDSTLWFSWFRFLSHQFHDDITGTSLPEVYALTSLPEEDSSIADFSKVLTNSNTAIAGMLDTRVSESGRVPIVLFNPLAIPRKDIVEVTVNLGTAVPAGVKVFDQAGREVPAQITSSLGQSFGIAFAASVPSLGYSVYQVMPVAAANPAAANLTIDETTGILENMFYKVTVSKTTGDITQILDKITNKSLLSAPSKFEGRTDISDAKAAWRMRYVDVSAAPVWTAGQSGNATVTAVEKGPARVAFKVVRTQGSSSFTHYIRLGADSAGSRIEVKNTIDWKTMGILLKLGVPMSCTNTKATFDLGIGTIQRVKNSVDMWETPAQNWADITSTDNSYGLSVLTDYKHGWDRPADNKLQLSLIHSPTGVTVNYYGDQFVHNFIYGLYGHAGDWTNGTVWEAQRMNQPIIAFQTTAHAGNAGTVFSFVQPNTSQMHVMAFKKARKGGDWVIRVREVSGKALTGGKIAFRSNLLAVTELNGIEDPKAGAPTPVFSGNTMNIDMTKYSLRTFLLSFDKTSAAHRFSTPLLSSERIVRVRLASGSMAGVAVRIPAGDKIRSIAILDANGRLVRELDKLNNALAISWDGKNTSGQPAGTGVYLVTVTTDKSRASASMTMIR